MAGFIEDSRLSISLWACTSANHSQRGGEAISIMKESTQIIITKRAIKSSFSV